MKKRSTIWIAGCVVLCYACQQQPGYRISGTIEGAKDGDTVKLVTYTEDWRVSVLQETLVKDGQFALTGRKDTAAFYYLSCVGAGQPLGSVEFVLENGDIKIHTKLNSFDYDIKGTPVNEAWSIFHNENEHLCGESLDLYRALQDSTLSEEVRAQKQAEMEASDKKLNAYRLLFCKEHIGDIAGAYALARYYKDFEPEVVAELVAQIPEICTMKEVLALKEEIANKQKTAIGRAFLDFSMTTPEGKNLSVSAVANDAKVTMIDFWASWCGPCRAEMPYVKAAYEKFNDKGFEVIGVSLDNSVDAWKKAIADLELPWPQMSDLKGWDCAGAVLYGVKAIPATILIQDGKIIARDLREEALAEKLAEILK